MVDARAAQVTEDVGARLPVALAHQITPQGSGISQPLVCAVSIQASVVPLGLGRGDYRWTVCSAGKVIDLRTDLEISLKGK